MEDVLHLYNLPLDEKRPLICFDERPVQLLGEVAAPLPMKKGQSARFDYEYEREGTACLLVAFEPLTGKRIVETSKQRTKADYCRFMLRVAEMFPQAESIVLVQDNLNTHNGIVNLTNRACRRPDLATYSVDAYRSCSLSPPSFPCRNH